MIRARGGTRSARASLDNGSSPGAGTLRSRVGVQIPADIKTNFGQCSVLHGAEPEATQAPRFGLHDAVPGGRPLCRAVIALSIDTRVGGRRPGRASNRNRAALGIDAGAASGTSFTPLGLSGRTRYGGEGQRARLNDFLLFAGRPVEEQSERASTADAERPAADRVPSADEKPSDPPRPKAARPGGNGPGPPRSPPGSIRARAAGTIAPLLPEERPERRRSRALDQGNSFFCAPVIEISFPAPKKTVLAAARYRIHVEW